MAAAARDALDADELEALWHAIISDAGDDNDNDNDNDDYDRGDMDELAAMPTGSGELSPCSPSTSVSDTIMTAAAADAAAGDATAGPPRRKPRQFTPAQVAMRRKRNRDSMRRVRQRKQVEVEHLRQQMELLEDKLDELRIVRDQTAAPGSASRAFSAAARPPVGRRTEAAVQALLEGIKALQVEQLRLHTAILSHQQVSASLAQLLNEAKSIQQPRTAPPGGASPNAGLFQDSDEFQWVNAVLPLLPPLTGARGVFELVRESYLDIVRHMASADAQLAAPNHVLGWSDRRAVAGGWADFFFSKSLAHERIDELAARTWRLLTYTDQSHGFQSKSLALKVLGRLNADTLIMARSSYSPRERTSFNSIYVLLRVETADGYLFGGRTVCPLPEYEARMHDALGDGHAYVHMFYGLTLSRQGAPSASASGTGTGTNRPCELVETSSRSPSPPSAAESPPPPPPAPLAGQDIHVRYGGRIGNGSALMAQAWAMDVLLAALRWENSCVKPLKLLRA
ncbi:hypothetical protein PybrP1_003585 [[Pythium] brassicae (nom. inval.)]|nr:hypothetical protein PybrP1_003585 [[Pythium] brassicae (nom. inval.)]